MRKNKNRKRTQYQIIFTTLLLKKILKLLTIKLF